VNSSTPLKPQLAVSHSPDMVSIGIIGAGFSGLGMAIKLKQAGFEDIHVYEAADDIGGTVSSHSCMLSCMQP
jgi:cation diffusion facilitator CzcD-associated flavoprotein CzcO